MADGQRCGRREIRRAIRQPNVVAELDPRAMIALRVAVIARNTASSSPLA